MTKEAYKIVAYGLVPTSPYDPRYQTEDIGDNAMRASGMELKIKENFTFYWTGPKKMEKVMLN
jgi:hypothetical protein